MESFILALLFTAVHLLSTWMDWKGVIDSIKVCTFWTLSRDAVMSFGDHGKQHGLHHFTLQQLRVYSLSFREGELHGEQHV
jgi:hypothetical protein